MADKEKKEKKEKKVVNPTEGQTRVQTSAEEIAPIEKKKKKVEAKPEPIAKAMKAARPDAKAKEGDSVDGAHLQRVPGNSKTPEEVKPEVKRVEAPSREEISRLAHHYWKERGGHHGSHDQDWLRAEQELRGKAS